MGFVFSRCDTCHRRHVRQWVPWFGVAITWAAISVLAYVSGY